MATLKWYQWLWKYLLIVIVAIGKFLEWAFAAQLTVFILSVIIYLSGKHFWGFLLFGLAILETIGKIKQMKQNQTANPPTS
jgi:hypothetical protein